MHHPRPCCFRGVAYDMALKKIQIVGQSMWTRRFSNSCNHPSAGTAVCCVRRDLYVVFLGNLSVVSWRSLHSCTYLADESKGKLMHVSDSVWYHSLQTNKWQVTGMKDRLTMNYTPNQIRDHISSWNYLSFKNVYISHIIYITIKY